MIGYEKIDESMDVAGLIVPTFELATIDALMGPLLAPGPYGTPFRFTASRFISTLSMKASGVGSSSSCTALMI